MTVEQRHTGFGGNRCQLMGADFGGEALDRVVGGVHLEDDGGPRGQRGAIIAGVD